MPPPVSMSATTAGGEPLIRRTGVGLTRHPRRTRARDRVHVRVLVDVDRRLNRRTCPMQGVHQRDLAGLLEDPQVRTLQRQPADRADLDATDPSRRRFTTATASPVPPSWSRPTYTGPASDATTWEPPLPRWRWCVTWGLCHAGRPGSSSRCRSERPRRGRRPCRKNPRGPRPPRGMWTGWTADGLAVAPITTDSSTGSARASA